MARSAAAPVSPSGGRAGADLGHHSWGACRSRQRADATATSGQAFDERACKLIHIARRSGCFGTSCANPIQRDGRAIQGRTSPLRSLGYPIQRGRRSSSPWPSTQDKAPVTRNASGSFESSCGSSLQNQRSAIQSSRKPCRNPSPAIQNPMRALPCSGVGVAAANGVEPKPP